LPARRAEACATPDLLAPRAPDARVILPTPMAARVLRKRVPWGFSMSSSPPPSRSNAPPVDVGANRVRLLHDGAQAFPAMLLAIAGAEREILLEMYWIGADRIGVQFRDALVKRASAGVRVRVLFDAIGSLETPDSFWRPLLEAGALVQEFSPISPFKRQFRAGLLAYRDHRKVLVVDGIVGFTGGINIGEHWAPPDAPESAWRDDAIEIRGPAVRALRSAFNQVWRRTGRKVTSDGIKTPRSRDRRVRVLTNRVGLHPSRSILRAYLLGLRRAERSIDIANAYFLPGPRFLHAMRRAARRGVRVRLLIPSQSDVWVVALAMSSLYGRLLSDGVEVYAYAPRVLHAKTAVFDTRYTMVGSHNLDTLSSRFNLECNVVVDSPEFARIARASFERDLADAERLDVETWHERPLSLRFLAWSAALFRSVL
jgi:cardiolipin synthase